MKVGSPGFNQLHFATEIMGGIRNRDFLDKLWFHSEGTGLSVGV